MADEILKHILKIIPLTTIKIVASWQFRNCKCLAIRSRYTNIFYRPSYRIRIVLWGQELCGGLAWEVVRSL